MRTTKSTRLGVLATAGVGVAGLALAGFALPASADDTSTTVEQSETTTDLTGSLEEFQAWVTDTISLEGTDVSPVTGVSPETGIGDVSLIEGPLVGDIGVGDIGSGNQTPIGSGNEVAAQIGSGNDVSAPIEAPIGSGNDTSVEAPVDVPVEAPVGNGTDVSTGGIGTDIASDVNDVVDGVTGDVGDLVDDVTSDLDLGGLLD